MKNKGVTIIELIITLFILSVGAIGVLSAMRQPIEQSGIAISTLRANYFAQEAIELIRNERDTIWIREEDLTVGALQLRTSYLNIDPIPNTKFKREITIEEIESGFIKINAIISWTEKDKDYEVNIQENIYNWL